MGYELVAWGRVVEPWPNTQPSLLVRIRDANDHLAWTHFVEVYAPPLYQYGRRQGLQDADAADLTQEIFRRVVRAMTFTQEGLRARLVLERRVK